MPKILEDRKKAIQKGNPNMPESEAYGIATKQLQKSGQMPKKVGGKGKSKGPNDPQSVMDGKSSFVGLFGKKKK